MTGPSYHAHTHRQKSRGGTDPLDIEPGQILLPSAIWNKTSGLPDAAVGGGVQEVTFDVLATQAGGADYFDLVSGEAQFKSGLYHVFGVIQFAAVVDWSAFTVSVTLGLSPSLAPTVGKGFVYDTNQSPSYVNAIEVNEPLNLAVDQGVVLVLGVQSGASTLPSGTALARLAAYRISDALSITL